MVEENEQIMGGRMARTESVKIRLTENENQFLEQQAGKLDISRSEYMRRLLIREMEKEEDKTS